MLDPEIVFLSPDGPEWNPHSDEYAKNEEQFLDWKGEMVEPQHRQRILIDDSDADAFVSSMEVKASELSAKENDRIDQCYMDAVVMGVEACEHPPWDTFDEVTPSLCGISDTLDLGTFSCKLMERGALSKYGMSVGSMHGAVYDISDLFITEASAAHAEAPKGVTAQQLSKVWKIDIDSAKRTREVTSQRRKLDTNVNL